MTGVELENIEVGEDFAEIKRLGLVEVEDHFVVDVVPFGEVETGFESADGLGEVVAPAAAGVAVGEVPEGMEAFFDLADAILETVGFEESAEGDFAKGFEGAVFFEHAYQHLIAWHLWDLLLEKRIDFSVVQCSKNRFGFWQCLWVDLPSGTDVLCRFEAGHFAPHQVPVHVAYPDKMEQAQVGVGEGHIEPCSRIVRLDITSGGFEQSVDGGMIEGFVLVVEIRIVKQIKETVYLLCPGGT